MVRAATGRLLSDVRLHWPCEEHEAIHWQVGGQEYTHGAPGYEEGSKVYKLFDPCAGRVVVSRDVIFDEMAA
jgi:hypothetical protein